MFLSTEGGWYDVNGNALFIPANKKYPDNAPEVKALPYVFEKISDDVPPGGVKAAVAKAKAAATSAGKSDG